MKQIKFSPPLNEHVIFEGWNPPLDEVHQSKISYYVVFTLYNYTHGFGATSFELILLKLHYALYLFCRKPLYYYISIVIII